MSDTHGLLRPEVVEDFRGVDRILHAGDIGKLEVVEGLRQVAPVTAIRGNVDRQEWAQEFPETDLVEIDGISIYLVHSRDWLDIDPHAAGVDVVLCGHSHKPLIEELHPVTYVNPGSCGPRRFSLPVSWARMVVDGYHFELELRSL